jgi:hypothetical protein
MRGRRALVAAVLAAMAWPIPGTGQEIERPGPPSREDFEADADGDGRPDGWYNLRDVERITAGGRAGPAFLRFTATAPSRPARASRAFGVDGRTTAALVVGVWVRAKAILPGERMGEEPGLQIDLLGEDIKAVSRGTLGPWRDRTLGGEWLHVARRLPVPPGARDAILSVGLFGATGTLDVDGLTIELVPRAGPPTTANLVPNGDFERGEAEPVGWVVEGSARRVSPGAGDSDAALELERAGARAQVGLALPVGRFSALEVTLNARAQGVRGGGASGAALYFVDDEGRPLPGARGGVRLFRLAGTFAWRSFRAVVPVPDGVARAVLQLDKPDAGGTLAIDDVAVSASPDPDRGTWTPDAEADRTDGWAPFSPAGAIEPGSALDASGLNGTGTPRRVVVKDGHLHFEGGPRARFFGVMLFPPLAFPTAERAEALADRLARSGVNLVRLSALDAPLGPGVSLFDDARDDTRTLDPEALGRFDGLVAALRRRGIHIALELNAQRRFRAGDGLAEPRALPPGGGPASAFDPTIRARIAEAGRLLLDHVNPATGIALKADPVLAWVTLAGECSLFDLIDDPNALPDVYAAALRDRIREAEVGVGRRAWGAIEGEQWAAVAGELRKAGLKAPIAGSSHWRREAEFNVAQAATGLDLIDDRLYWAAPPWGDPGRRSALFTPGTALVAQARAKRRADRPYVVGETASHTGGAWALPFEGADLLLVAAQAGAEDWDALVRRGVAPEPQLWGAGPTGSTGDLDVVPLPEALNAHPAVFGLLPHAASLVRRPVAVAEGRRPPDLAARDGLGVATPHTVAVAGGRAGPRPAAIRTPALDIAVESEYASVAASAVGEAPLERAGRVLVTAVGRVVPTGVAWSDGFRRVVADPGRGPLLLEPVRVRLVWKRPGPLQVFRLDNAGRRVGPEEVSRDESGAVVTLRGGATMHWELVAE